MCKRPLKEIGGYYTQYQAPHLLVSLLSYSVNYIESRCLGHMLFCQASLQGNGPTLFLVYVFNVGLISPAMSRYENTLYKVCVITTPQRQVQEFMTQAKLVRDLLRGFCQNCQKITSLYFLELLPFQKFKPRAARNHPHHLIERIQPINKPTWEKQSRAIERDAQMTCLDHPLSSAAPLASCTQNFRFMIFGNIRNLTNIINRKWACTFQVGDLKMWNVVNRDRLNGNGDFPPKAAMLAYFYIHNRSSHQTATYFR